jgi:hypothetical protein
VNVSLRPAGHLGFEFTASVGGRPLAGSGGLRAGPDRGRADFSGEVGAPVRRREAGAETEHAAISSADD